MKPLIRLAVVVLVLAGSAFAYQKVTTPRSRYVDTTFGYSMDLPRFPAGDAGQAVMPALFSAPPSGGFSSNMNIRVQPSDMKLAEFREQNVGELKKVGFTIIKTTESKISGRDTFECEFEGAVNNGPRLHFLSLSVLEKDRVLTITCTATMEGFKAVESEFRASLKSLKFP
jgi:hypothetical protein